MSIVAQSIKPSGCAICTNLKMLRQTCGRRANVLRAIVAYEEDPSSYAVTLQTSRYSYFARRRKTPRSFLKEKKRKYCGSSRQELISSARRSPGPKKCRAMLVVTAYYQPQVRLIDGAKSWKSPMLWQAWCTYPLLYDPIGHCLNECPSMLISTTTFPTSE